MVVIVYWTHLSPTALDSFQLLNPIHRLYCPAFFTYNKPEPLGHSFTFRMNSKLEEGFKQISEMWTAPSSRSAAVGLPPGGRTHRAPESCSNTPEHP